MVEFERDRHEDLITAWYYHLRTDKTEFANLFAEPLRHLGALLNWVEHSVKFVFNYDDDGITYAGWFEPYMSGCFFGFWSRKDQRKGIAQAAFINHIIDEALKKVPIVIALTKRPELEPVLLRLGFKLAGDFPHIFDNADAIAYAITRESRRNRYGWIGRRKDQPKSDIDHESLRGPAGLVREIGASGLQDVEQPDTPSPPNRGSERPDSHDQPKRRRRKASRKHLDGEHEGSTGAVGLGTNGIRPESPG